MLVADLTVNMARVRGFAGLRFSDNMSDEPYAELLVVDEASKEYLLEIEVTLTPTPIGVTRRPPVTRKAKA